MKPLPQNLVAYKRTPIFTHTATPAGLTRRHSTKKGVWAVLQVLEGSLAFSWLDGDHRESTAEAGTQIVVPPEVPHKVAFEGPASFVLTFYKAPCAEHADAAPQTRAELCRCRADVPDFFADLHT